MVLRWNSYLVCFWVREFVSSPFLVLSLRCVGLMGVGVSVIFPFLVRVSVRASLGRVRVNSVTTHTNRRCCVLNYMCIIILIFLLSFFNAPAITAALRLLRSAKHEFRDGRGERVVYMSFLKSFPYLKKLERIGLTDIFYKCHVVVCVMFVSFSCLGGAWY